MEGRPRARVGRPVPKSLETRQNGRQLAQRRRRRGSWIPSPRSSRQWGTALGWLLGERIPTARQLDFRAGMTGLALIIALFVTGARLVYLQHQQAPLLQQRAEAQQRAQLRPFIPRRSIVDRHSIAKQQAELLAVDRPVYTLWAHPRLFGKRTPEEIATALAPLLRRPVEQLAQRLSANQAVRVERWVSQEVADQIQALHLDGLELVSERQRIYPQKEMAAEVVGYVDLDHQGQAGVEYSRQELLERTVQPVTIPRDGYGRLLAAEVPEGLLQSGETVLQYCGSSLLLYYTGARLFSDRAGLISLAAISIAPILWIGFGVLTLPDSPLVFFTAATLWVASQEFFPVPLGQGKLGVYGAARYRPGPRLALIGLLVGLACLGKYHGLALGFGLVLFCLLSPVHRCALRSGWTVLAVLGFVLAFSPVLIWNAQQDWVSFRFQAGRAVPV